MFKNIFFGVSLFFAFSPFFVFALANDYDPVGFGAGKPELHITQDGKMIIKSAKVDQILGTTFFLQIKWGQLPMRFTMKTDEKTEMKKRHGGSAQVSQIKLGDYIDGEGEFFVGSDFFGFNASRIKNWSMQEETETFSGTIKEVNGSNFILSVPSGKTITVQSGSGLVIKKGAVVVPWSRVKQGDSVVLADGVYDYSKNILTASNIILFQSKADFSPRNYQGTLKSVSSAELPSSLVISVDGKDYIVKISVGSAVLRKNRNAALLARFVPGDIVRFYGGLREEEKTLNDDLIIDAEVVRNLSL